MNKSLPVLGLCALMSVGSILYANEIPAPAEKNTEHEIVVPGPDMMRQPQRFKQRRGGRNFDTARQGRRNFKAKADMPGKNCKGIDFRHRGSRRGFNGHHGLMTWGKGRFNIGCHLIPRVPMNEDEMAKFASLKMDLQDALKAYRAENSETNTTALRVSVDKLVTAAQQYEIERCEKALARAKAAVAQKDKIVERTIKKITDLPRPAEGRPHPQHHAEAK